METDVYTIFNEKVLFIANTHSQMAWVMFSKLFVIILIISVIVFILFKVIENSFPTPANRVKYAISVIERKVNIYIAIFAVMVFIPAMALLAMAQVAFHDLSMLSRDLSLLLLAFLSMVSAVFIFEYCIKLKRYPMTQALIVCELCAAHKRSHAWAILAISATLVYLTTRVLAPYITTELFSIHGHLVKEFEDYLTPHRLTDFARKSEFILNESTELHLTDKALFFKSFFFEIIDRLDYRKHIDITTLYTVLQRY